MNFRRTPSETKVTAWHSLRVQLAGCLLFALAIPYLLRVILVREYVMTPAIEHTLIASFAAIIVGTWLLRSLRIFPGVAANSYTLPSMSLAYGLALLVLFLGRLEYNRLLLGLGAFVSVAWFYAVQILAERARALRIGVVPFGLDNTLPQVAATEWIILDKPGMIAPVEAVVADLRIDLPREWDKQLADYALAGVPVYHFKSLLESLTGKVELEHLSENSFGSLTPVRSYMFVKHGLDWVAAAVALALATPALLLVTIAIRLESRGPAIFRQKRMGQGGRLFTVYKFRTMRHGFEVGEATREAAMTKSSDPRITRLGRVLRRSRIDELPQLINILRAEMSWIGPRPEAEVLSYWYEGEIPFYRYRHIVRPGITGWAQVNQGHVAEVDEVRAKLHYDFFYIKNFSPWIDLLIVARTLRTMLTGFGSR